MREKENITSGKISLEVIGILLKTSFAFVLIRILSTSVFIFRNSSTNLIVSAVQFAIFTYWIYKYISGEAAKKGLTLEDCYIPRMKVGINDVLFALLIVSAFSLGVSLFAKQIVPTNVEFAGFLTLAIANFFRSGLASGINEEVVYRGYLLKVLEEKTGRKWAAVLSSIAFGLGHIFNREMTLPELLCILIGTGSIGLMWSVITYETGNIWRGVIVHMFTNTKERVIGFDLASSLFRFDYPADLTSEARSCINWIVISVISWIVILWYRRKRKRNKE